MDPQINLNIRAGLIEYVVEFLKGYQYAIDTNFPDVKTFVLESRLDRALLPLYGRQLGVNVAIAVFASDSRLFVFFTDEPDVEIQAYAEGAVSNSGESDREWGFNTPIIQQVQRAIEHLGIEESKIFQLGDAKGAIFISTIDTMSIQGGARPSLAGHPTRVVNGYRNGVSFGNAAGQQAEAAVPQLKQMFQRHADQRAISARYRELVDSGMSPNARGIEFEKLWRDVLDFYGWKAKKIRIPGEDNDFTAIYQGLHILGEVRWFDKPMDGGKMREFLAKLDPRPQTIGLFISHSDVDKGGMSVVRRAVNSKTVVIFGKAEIEQIMLESADPGSIFDEKLRDVYDNIFEFTEDS